MKMNEMVGVAGSRPEVFVINWNIGKRCNYACSYCPKDLHDHDSGHLSLEEMRFAFASVVEAKHRVQDHRTIRLEVTGGEPTLNPHLASFLEWLRGEVADRLDTVGITTNGSRSVDYYNRLIQLVDYITFSPHFEFMQEGEFVKTVLLTARRAADCRPRRAVTVNLMLEPWARAAGEELLTILQAEAIPVRCTAVRNYYDSEGLEPKWVQRFDYAAFLATHGPPIGGSTDSRVNSTGGTGDAPSAVSPGNGDSPNRAPSRDQLSYWLSEDATVRLKDGRRLPVVSSALIDNGLNSFIDWTCNVGEQGIHIYNNGNVYSSICRARLLGNIFTGFSMVTAGVICKKDRCVCPADIRITKERRAE